MKWKNVKFWCWLDITFPDIVGNIEDADDAVELYAGIFNEPKLKAGPYDDCTTPGGTTICFDLLSFQSEFELNGIPTASVSVALGRRADDVTKAADIHYYIDQLRMQLPATVWCLAKTLDGSDLTTPEWPTEKFRIFLGNVTASGFRRNTTGAEFILTLTHWLSDLNFSSAVSKQSHPLNPSQYFFKANHVLDEALIGGVFLEAAGPLMVGPQLAMPFFPPSTLLSDFWGGFTAVDGEGNTILNGLKAWLLFLTKQDRINSTQILSEGGVPVDAALNKEACRALRRFEPNAVGDDFDETGLGYILGVPLAITSNPDLNVFMADSIGLDIGLEGLSGYENITLWDKLAGQFHSNYMFSIVPLIEKALVVPFVPGLSSNIVDTLVHRIIRTSQYDSIDLQVNMPRPLRGVGVLLERKNEAGGGLSKDNSAPYSGIGGYYDKWLASCTPGPCSTAYKEGLIMFKQGPKWMSNFVCDFLYTAKSTGKDGDGIASSTSTTAGSPHATTTPRDILSASSSIWQKYAQTLYIHEVLKTRQGMITGPVRFDIAPGSQIKVEIAEDKYVKSLIYAIPPGEECNDDFFTWYWCSVLRVSTVIDCQNNKAMTSFYVSHIRNQQENSDSGTSIESHPIWQEHKWAGCVLVEDAVFSPLSTTG